MWILLEKSWIILIREALSKFFFFISFKLAIASSSSDTLSMLRTSSTICHQRCSSLSVAEQVSVYLLRQNQKFNTFKVRISKCV